MVRPQWPYAAAREQILSDESGGCSGAGEVAGEARPGQSKSAQGSAEGGRANHQAHKNNAPAAGAESCGASYSQNRTSRPVIGCYVGNPTEVGAGREGRGTLGFR